MSRARITDNPFYVLGLRPDCSRADLEREGQKLLALLELGMASAKTYATPLGPMPRTADRVRQAMAELRDPRRRLVHELWAQLPASPPGPDATTTAAPRTAPSANLATPGGAATSDQDATTTSAHSPAPSADPAARTAAEAESAATRGPPPAWPEARAIFGFGAPR